MLVAVDETRQPNSPRPATHVEQFRGPTRQRSLHPLEVYLLCIVSVHLVFLSWAFGGVRLWGQVISLILAAASFCIAMSPRIYPAQFPEEGPYRVDYKGKLFRFPVFWIGLALLGYITIQGLNPAWIYLSDGKVWWMRRVDFVTWLPAGVTASPSRGGGPWQILIIYASAWLTMCAIWVGFTRRRSVRTLFIVITGNGFALAAFGLVQRLLSNGKIFWLWTSPNGAFFASFTYKNHAGAYLNLCLATAAGLAAWRYLHGLRRMERSNPASLYVFIATVIALSVFVSYSRGAAIAMMVFVCLAGVGFLLYQWHTPNASSRLLVILSFVVLIGIFLRIGFESLDAGEAWTRLNQVFSGEDTSVAARKLANKASGEMYQDYWLRGAGAGGFRYLFPSYQQHYPELQSVNGQALYWEHAHNDILELPIELGLGGMLLVLAAGGWWLRLQLQSHFWKTPLGLLVIIGGILTVLHAAGDFIFECPAILLLWCSLFIATALWSKFESRPEPS
jgi:hypothetical protein